MRPTVGRISVRNSLVGFSSGTSRFEICFHLTHVLTHNRKRADGYNGAKTLGKQIHPSEKGWKCLNSTQSTP